MVYNNQNLFMPSPSCSMSLYDINVYFDAHRYSSMWFILFNCICSLVDIKPKAVKLKSIVRYPRKKFQSILTGRHPFLSVLMLCGV